MGDALAMHRYKVCIANLRNPAPPLTGWVICHLMSRMECASTNRGWAHAGRSTQGGEGARLRRVAVLVCRGGRQVQGLPPGLRLRGARLGKFKG
jgi:hypothetical protein